MAPPPPSFSSFPEPKKPNQSIPPPKFDSFPRPRRSPSPDARPPPPKRPPASAAFLDGLQDELVASGKGFEERAVASSSKSRKHHADDERRSKREPEGKSSSSRHGKGSEKREKDLEKADRKERKERKREREERDSDYGQSKKSYKLVKALANGATRSPSPRQDEPSAASEPRTFYSDRRGDEYNIRYGSLHKGDVPRYRRLGAGRIVGLNSGLRITKESAYTNRGLEVGAHTGYRTPRYTDPRSANYTTSLHTKRLFILSQNKASSTTEDPFLATSTDPARFVKFEPQQTFPEKLMTLEFEEGQDYRSIAGMIKPSDFEEEESEEAGDDAFDGLGIEGGESRDAYLKRRNIELDRSLRENPQDEDQWIAFVEFQDEVALSSFGGSTQRTLSTTERRTTSEIKLSILTRALSHPENRASEKLLRAFLNTAAQIWEAKDVLEKWDETLKKNPDKTGLWIEYVSWRQTTWANFEVRNVVDVFVDAFGVLREAKAKERVGTTGYAERALAAFQTIIELNFFRPSSLQSAKPTERPQQYLSRLYDSLESFWDSGAPRIGEAGAKGWSNTSEDASPPPIPTFPPPPSPLPSDSLDPFAKWASLEKEVPSSQSLPARPDDPGVSDDIDPFRVVLFDDVRDFIFTVHSTDSLIQLAYAFLTFLGLPFIPPDFPTSTPFSTDGFIHSGMAEKSSARDRFWPNQVVGNTWEVVGGEPMERERKGGLESPDQSPFRSCPATVDGLFTTRPKWFVALDKVGLEDVNVDLVRNVFTLLRPLVSDGFFTLNFFAFEAALSPKAYDLPPLDSHLTYHLTIHRAIKLAKTVLRTERQNLALWDGYARLERSRGKAEDARVVYVTALSMYRDFDPKDQLDGPLLWRAWAEMEWEAGRPMLALRVLVTSAEDEGKDLGSLAKVESDTRPSPAQILKARQYYTHLLASSFQDNVSQSMLRNRNHLAYSFAIFEYCSQGLQPAAEVLEQHLLRLDNSGAIGSAEHEEAYMLYVKLLYRHSSAGGGFRPSQLREVLERAIKVFPNNQLFLSVFFHNELRMKIQNHVRRTLEANVLQDKIVTSQGWLFAIFAELHLDVRSHNEWGVRNLFDRAVAHPKTRSSPALWTLYIDFECRNGELGRAKALLYRGIRKCPWVKGSLSFPFSTDSLLILSVLSTELYLMPFSLPLRSTFQSKELRQMHSLLLEKGLRVKIELDDALEGRGVSDVELEEEEVNDHTSGLMNETEELYRERTRLMPY
ncbi:nuclear exosome regulator NRDE2, partial [Phenoliferia sp. Uapishka_3]